MTRHPLDVLSLAFGLLFLAVGAAALADVIDFELLTLDWLWPAVLIGSGVAVLLTLGSREPGTGAEPADGAGPADRAADGAPTDGG